VTVDFEPWEDGLAFEVADSAAAEDHFRPEMPGFHAALVEGIREELAEQVTDMPLAVAVILRRIRVHEVDSHDRAFRMAGRLAVREALGRLHGSPPRPKRRRSRPS
jgi:elongation factor G